MAVTTTGWSLRREVPVLQVGGPGEASFAIECRRTLLRGILELRSSSTGRVDLPASR
jgi:hypothetical protein